MKIQGVACVNYWSRTAAIDVFTSFLISMSSFIFNAFLPSKVKLKGAFYQQEKTRLLGPSYFFVFIVASRGPLLINDARLTEKNALNLKSRCNLFRIAYFRGASLFQYICAEIYFFSSISFISLSLFHPSSIFLTISISLRIRNIAANKNYSKR